jgi:hypothetical protein
MPMPGDNQQDKGKDSFSLPLTINPIYDSGQIELHCIMLIFIVGMFKTTEFQRGIFWIFKKIV